MSGNSGSLAEPMHASIPSQCAERRRVCALVLLVVGAGCGDRRDRAQPDAGSVHSVATSPTAVPSGALRGAVTTFSIAKTLELPRRPRTSRCSPSSGTYRVETLKVQPVRSDLKATHVAPDFEPGTAFELEASYTNTGDEECDPRLFIPLAEDGTNLGEDGPVALFSVTPGESFQTNEPPRSYSVPPKGKQRIVVRYVAPKGMTRVILGIDAEMEGGAKAWLTIDLEKGSSQWTMAKKPPLVLRPKNGPPGTPPAPRPGAVWTFPSADQTEPDIPHPAGPYPALRTEAHLVAPDGTTFVERWFPARIQCIDGATGKVRWEHAMPALVDALGRPVEPRIDASRMRLVSSSGALLIVDPKDDDATLVALASADGKELWRLPLSRAEQGALFLDAGSDAFLSFAVGSTTHTDTITAHAMSDGKPTWQVTLGKDCKPEGSRSHGVFASPVEARAERVLVRTSCEAAPPTSVLTMLDAAKGTEVWHAKTETEAEVVWHADGTVYTTTPTLYRALDPGTGATRWETSNQVRLPLRTPMIPPRLEAVGRGGLRYFWSVEATDVEHADGPATYYAVDARQDRVLETLAALPAGPDVTLVRRPETMSLAREITPLADGKSAIVRDQGEGRIARIGLP